MPGLAGGTGDGAVTKIEQGLCPHDPDAPGQAVDEKGKQENTPGQLVLSAMKMNKVGTFLVVQGFSLNASNAGGLGLVSCFGELRSYICLMVWPSGEKKKDGQSGGRGDMWCGMQY